MTTTRTVRSSVFSIDTVEAHAMYCDIASYTSVVTSYMCISYSISHDRTLLLIINIIFVLTILTLLLLSTVAEAVFAARL